MMTDATRTPGFRGERFAFDSPGAALEAVITRGQPVHGTEPVLLALAGGRILADAVTLDRDSPPFDHSAMDGYAIGAGGCDGDGTMRVIGESRIGRAGIALTDTHAAIRISTGAPLPAGCDRVIMREDVEEIHDADGAVAAIRPAPGAMAKMACGTNVRRRGENAAAGTQVAAAGTVLTASTIAAIAAAGAAQARVVRRVRVACVTTGDELAAPGTPADAFTIANSNLPAISCALRAQAWAEVMSAEAVQDEVDTVAAALASALGTSDAVVMTGGVSMGHRDPVREALARVGAQVIFHGLPQRPGKPMLVACVERAQGSPQLIFALPGNPVSALATFVRIALPALRALGGGSAPDAHPSVALCNDDGKRLDLWWHRLVTIDADGRARLLSQRGSGDLVALGQSSGFVEIAPNEPAGGLHRYFPWPR